MTTTQAEAAATAANDAEPAIRLSMEEIQRTVSPVFVLGPTARNGITLIQRLLNSSRRIIVYGENTALMHALPEVVMTTVTNHQKMCAELDEYRRRFLNGETEGWTSNLWPDSNRFTSAVCESFYKAVMVYEQCSREYGYSRWGVKNPLSNPYIIPWMLTLLPRCRFVFIHRHLFDVVRSAKARKFITDDAQLRKYADQYQTNMHAVLNTPRDQTMIIKQEQLVAEPEPIIQRLEAFAGVSEIDRTVMQRKINTFPGTRDQGRSYTGYIDPEELTDREKAICLEHARPTLQQAGYV
jgi:hypothetical protein